MFDDDDDKLYSCLDVFSWCLLGTQHKDKKNNEWYDKLKISRNKKAIKEAIV